jgi:hypothetical protein
VRDFCAAAYSQLDYPKSQDPNDYEIYLTSAATNTTTFNFAAGGGWVKIGAGINSMGHRWVLDRNAHDIRCGRGLHYCWQNFIHASVTGETVTNYFVHRVRCTDGSKIHASILEWKSGGWQEGIRSAFFNMFNTGTASGIYCKDCTIGDFHEVFVASNDFNQVRLRNSTIKAILDDGFQTRWSMSRCEIGYCYFDRSDWGGFGEAGVDGNDAVPNNWFIHHNIMDCRREKNSNWRAQPHPQDVYTPHSPDGNSPKFTITSFFVALIARRNSASALNIAHRAPAAATTP